jgi:hypothetical protein
MKEKIETSFPIRTSDASRGDADGSDPTLLMLKKGTNNERYA